MAAKKLIIGQTEWTIADRDADAVARAVEKAMTDGTSIELPLADSAGRAVRVFLNGAVTSSVVLDLDQGPRPSEMS